MGRGGGGHRRHCHRYPARGGRLIEALLERIAALPPAGVYLAIAALAALENVFPPVPADTAAALGGFLAARYHHINVTAVFAVTILANVASATAMFYLARRLGPGFRASRLGRRLLPPRAVHAVQQELERHPRVGIFVSRCLPVYRAVVPPFAGMVGISAGRALPAIALASGLFYAGVIWLAHSVGTNWDGVREAVARLSTVLLLAAGAVTLYLAWRIWRRRHAGHRESEARAGDDPS